MDMFAAFALVALGAALDAAHHYICDNATCQAHKNGYEQAQKEELIRIETEKRCQTEMFSYIPPRFHNQNTKRLGESMVKGMADGTRLAAEAPSIDKSIMDSLQASGHAAARIK